VNQDQKTIDISSRKVVTMRDVQDAVAAGAHRVVTGANCVITPSARDFLQQKNISLVSSGTAKAAACAVAPAKSSSNGTATKGVSASNPKLFSTPEAEAIKKEICEVGRKLWMKSFG